MNSLSTEITVTHNYQDILDWADDFIFDFDSELEALKALCDKFLYDFESTLNEIFPDGDHICANFAAGYLAAELGWNPDN